MNFQKVMGGKRDLAQTTDDVVRVIGVKKTRDVGDFMLVWCYGKTPSDQLVKTFESLCDDIHHFQDSDECISYLRSLNPKKRVFLVIPSAFNALETAHSIIQVDTIFIFDYETKLIVDAYDTNHLSKLIFITGDLKELVESIIHTSTELSNGYQFFNLYDHKQKSLCNLSETSASFLWFQLLKNMLLNPINDRTERNREDTVISKECMINECYRHYQHDPIQLKNIDKFKETYQASDAIQWYTGNSFIYKIINRALRTEDLEVLHTFRFYIADLCSSLATKYQETYDVKNHVSILYRGSQMTQEEIDGVKMNEGCLIATNGFLSASRNREVAKMFAGSGKMIMLNETTRTSLCFLNLD